MTHRALCNELHYNINMKLNPSVQHLTVFLTVILVALLPSRSHPEENRWKFIGKSGTETRWYIDIKSMSHPSHNLVSVWVRSVPDPDWNYSGTMEDGEGTEEILKRIQERYFGDYGHTEALWEIDCLMVSFRLLYFSAYRRDGEILFSTHTPDAEWSLIIPGSVGEIVPETVCGPRQ